MGIAIEKYNQGELFEINRLIRSVYDEFVAPDYCDTGNQLFYDYISTNNMEKRIADGTDQIYTAKINGMIAGVIAFKNLSHLSLLFVSKQYHGQGIARKMFNHHAGFIVSEKIDEITVNASPYSKPIYEKLGFMAVSEMKELNGIKYFPMIKKL